MPWGGTPDNRRKGRAKSGFLAVLAAAINLLASAPAGFADVVNCGPSSTPAASGAAKATVCITGAGSQPGQVVVEVSGGGRRARVAASNGQVQVEVPPLHVSVPEPEPEARGHEREPEPEPSIPTPAPVPRPSLPPVVASPVTLPAPVPVARPVGPVTQPRLPVVAIGAGAGAGAGASTTSENPRPEPAAAGSPEDASTSTGTGAPAPAVGAGRPRISGGSPPRPVPGAQAIAEPEPLVITTELVAAAGYLMTATPNSSLLFGSLLFLLLLLFAVTADRRYAARQFRADLAAALGVSVGEVPPMSPSIAQAVLAAVQPVAERSAQLSQMVMHDDLTGVYRRGAGMALLAREVARADRALMGRLAVAFVDVNGLKSVNDTRGHAAGDALLKTVGAALAQRLRANDLAFRFGGDEFVCVLVDVDLTMATRIMSEISSLADASTGRNALSFGIATYRPGDTGEKLVERADAALYAKRRGEL